MNEIRNLIDATYNAAKSGQWDKIISEWIELPVLARRCSRYQKPSSGWTFLHQAAYFGNEPACRELIRLGADAGKLSTDRKPPADIASAKGHKKLADLLQRATQDAGSLWFPSPDPDLLPSSRSWKEAKERHPEQTILVAYGGGLVRIPKGNRCYLDSLKPYFFITFFTLFTGQHLSAAESECELSGTGYQWIADYCLLKTGTDDLVTARPCIDHESTQTFKSSCLQKKHV